MSLTTATYIKSVAPWMNSVPDADFGEHIIDAEIRLRDWVGDSNYDSAVSEGTSTNRGKRLKLAEAMLVVANMIPGLNTVFGDNGLSVQTSTGDGDVTYLSPAQVEKEVMRYVQRAERLSTGYFVSTNVVNKSEADADDSDRYL